jgi:hypothetical protein
MAAPNASRLNQQPAGSPVSSMGCVMKTASASAILTSGFPTENEVLRQRTDAGKCLGSHAAGQVGADR